MTDEALDPSPTTTPDPATALDSPTATESPEATDPVANAASVSDVPLLQDGAIRGFGPSDGEPLEPVPCTDPTTLPDVVARARVAQSRLQALDVDARARLVRKFCDAVLARGEQLVKVLQRECGKVEAEARLVEVLPTADLAAYWGREAVELFAVHEPELDAISFPGKRAWIERAPRGVVALITPWNFPVAIPMRTIVPAILAGDAIVLKPSEYAPRCAQLLEDAARETLGPDALIVVQGGGDVGAALIAAGVDAVVFTGSVATGKKVAHAAADALIPAGLELGGKDAAIVLEDCLLERTAQGLVWGAFANAGQNCAAIERVYVVRAVADALRARVKELTRGLVLGRDVPPMTTPAQRALVLRQLESARGEGATVTGGAAPERAGSWLEPAVIEGVPESADVMVEETFGPVLPIVVVQDEAEAVRRANESRFGLTASVWTKDLRRGERVARSLRAGVVTVNNHAFTGAIPVLPWTGVGESGYGVTNSSHALDLLTRPRALLIDASRAKRELWWYPYTPALVAIARSMTDLRRGGAGIGAKVRAVFALIGGFLSRWKV